VQKKNGRKTPKTAKGGQCRRKRTPNPSCCPLLWDLTDRKQYHNGADSRIAEVLKEIHLRIPVGRSMGHRSISDQLPIEDSTSKKNKVARLGTAGGAITRHYWPAYWDLELDYRWRGKDGEASVGRKGSLKLLIYINKNFRRTFQLFLFCAPADSSFWQQALLMRTINFS